MSSVKLSVAEPETQSTDETETGFRWEASAMGLASIFLGLGLLGLLFSLCTVCLRRKRSKEKITFRQKEATMNNTNTFQFPRQVALIFLRRNCWKRLGRLYKIFFFELLEYLTPVWEDPGYVCIRSFVNMPLIYLHMTSIFNKYPQFYPPRYYNSSGCSSGLAVTAVAQYWQITGLFPAR